MPNVSAALKTKDWIFEAKAKAKAIVYVPRPRP